VALKTVWFHNLPKEEQEQFKQTVLGSQKVLDKLREICYTMKVESKSTDYDSPSWAFKQAHSNGYNQALLDIISILQIEKETK
jgi:hypothetical protein